ncbi:MAG: nucleotidyltransferase domain-containing protein [Acidobacteriota bacterium]
MKNSGIERRLVPALEKHDGLVGAYLFGSRSTEEYSAQSDMDIGLLFEATLSFQRLVEIQLDLEDAVGLRSDVVDLRTASSFLALDIVRGIRVFCADDYRCDQFELFVLSRAGDLAPFERQRRSELLGTVAP